MAFPMADEPREPWMRDDADILPWWWDLSFAEMEARAPHEPVAAWLMGRDY